MNTSNKKQLPTQFSIKGLPKNIVTEFKTKLKENNTTVTKVFEDMVYDYIAYYHNVYIEDIKSILQNAWGQRNYITVGTYKPVTISTYYEDNESKTSGVTSRIYYPDKKTHLFVFEDKVCSLYMTESLQEEMIKHEIHNKQYYESTYISPEGWTEWFTNLISLNKPDIVKETVDIVKKYLINWTDNCKDEVYYNTKIYGDLSGFCVSEMAKMKV